jgi:hypothetical protein
VPERRLLPRPHGRSRARDAHAVRRRRHLEQPGQIRRVGYRRLLLQYVQNALQGGQRLRAAADRELGRPRVARVQRMALPPHRGVGCAHARGNSSREARRHFHRGGAADGVARNHPARRVGHRLLARAPGRADVRVPAPQYRAVVARASGQVPVVDRAGQSALDDGQLFLSVVAALCDARSRETALGSPSSSPTA